MSGRLRGWVRCRSSWVLEPERVVEPRVGGCMQGVDDPPGQVVDDGEDLGVDSLAAEQPVVRAAPRSASRGIPRWCRTTAPRWDRPRRTSVRTPPTYGRCTCQQLIIWSNSATYFGTPNGQASTQLEHPMHRGLSADCTTPPSVCLIASAGRERSRTSGPRHHAHPSGAVWVEAAQSTRSR